MEEILDRQLELQKDERIINRITASARYVYIAYACYLVTSVLVNDTEAAISGAIAYKTKTIIGVFITVLFFYYNIRHANAECNSKYIYPLFRQPLVIIFVFYTCYLLFNFGKGIIDSLLAIQSFPEYFHVLLELILGNTIAVVALTWIASREFVYLKRILKS